MPAKTSVQCCQLKGIQQIGTKFVGKDRKKYAGEKKPLLEEKQQEKRTWGLCTGTLKFALDAAVRQGCTGVVPPLTSDSAMG